MSDEAYAQLSPEALNNYLTTEAQSVKMPYLILGILVLLVAVLFMVSKLPDVKEGDDSKAGNNPFKAFRHRHLIWAVVAQFFMLAHRFV